jgi:rhodanese-related sulfurtransferase
VKAVVTEILAIGALGLVLAIIANAASPKGLSLGRDYFRAAESRSSPPTNVVAAAENGAAHSGSISTSGAGSDPHADAIRQRLKAKGLEPIETSEVQALHSDPRFQSGLIVFVDARADEPYQQGHIPGAYQLDYYRPQNYLPQVLPAVAIAEKVVVYCNGGECEDSEFTALMLRDAGVPLERLRIFAGGITHWTSNSLPVEIGARGSGVLKP